MQTTLRSRLSAALRRGGLGATVFAAALALLLSLSMSAFLNRDLLGEVNAASTLMERHQLVAAAHDAAVVSLSDVCRVLQPGAAGPLDRKGVGERVDAFKVQLERLARLMASAPGVAASPAYREALPRLQALSAHLASRVALPLAAESLAPALLPDALGGIEPLLALGRGLRLQADAERLDQQASMLRLRTRTVGLTYLMCLLFSLTVALATHGVLLARREVRTRESADAARAQAVAASERAEAAGRDKSKFLGMLSHELLTPLQSIVSSMDMIESRGRVDVGDPLFLRLREGTRALRARMSDLVDFARMTAGRLAVSPRRFRIDRLVEEVLADHEEALLRKDLDVHWEAGDSLRKPVVTDPRRVRQILDNLVSNAIKYTERGGLTVHAAIEGDGRVLCLEVRDTGVGIDAAALAQIFDPFYRVATTAQLADGSGLGLAVVRSLVELLEGSIDAESVPGEGSRFTVRLPIGVPGPGEAPAAGAPADAASVLIVDDAHDVRGAVADVVRSLGFVPAEAGSGGEALQRLAERAYAAVLLDIELPDIAGSEVARRVRAGDGPNRATRLVMLSASNSVGLDGAALFDARVDKPVERAQLQAVLGAAPST